MGAKKTTGNLDLYFVVEGLSLTDVLNAKALDQKIEIYKKLIRFWFLTPASKLTSSGDRSDKMAAFALQLAFFEPHGNCISTKGGNGEKFKRGLEHFLNYLSNENQINLNKAEIDVVKNEMWDNARCGIFHALTPRGVSVDYFDMFKNIFNIFGGKVIINTTQLSLCLQKYIDIYFFNMSSEEQTNFLRHYNEIVLAPIQKLKRQL